MIFPFSWYRPYPSDRISFLVDLLPDALHFLFNVDEVQIDKMAANNLFRTRSMIWGLMFYSFPPPFFRFSFFNLLFHLAYFISRFWAV